MRPSSPLRILLLTTLLAAAAAVLLVVSGPASADPGTEPAGGVWPLDPQQSQGRIDVGRWAQHVIASTLQRDIELHCDKELIFHD